MNGYFLRLHASYCLESQFDRNIPKLIVSAFRSTNFFSFNQESSCLERYFENIQTVSVRSVLTTIHSVNRTSLVDEIEYQEVFPANLRYAYADEI